MSEPRDRKKAAQRLITLHQEVDAQAGRLAALHGARLRCQRGCHDCCVDGLTVFQVEAERIAAGHAELLAEGRPHPAGACAFLDGDGACRIYEDRPYVCRTQGLPLRWVEEEEEEDGPLIEQRDICPLNLEGPPLADLPETALYELGPAEMQLQTLELDRAGDGAWTRVALRSLFGKQGV